MRRFKSWRLYLKQESRTFFRIGKLASETIVMTNADVVFDKKANISVAFKYSIMPPFLN